MWCPFPIEEDADTAAYDSLVRLLAQIQSEEVKRFTWDDRRMGKLSSTADAEKCALFHAQTDQYVVLAAALHSTQLFDDESFSELAQGYTLDDVIHLGTLPDFRPYITYIKYWGDMMHQWDWLENSFWCRILSQVLPNPGRSRMLDGSLKTFLTTEGTALATRDMLLRVLTGGLLGIYPWSQCQAPLPKRMMIYTMMVIARPDVDHLLHVINIAHNFVVMAMREFLFYTIRTVPAIYDFLVRQYNWTEMEEIVFQCMDAVRDLIYAWEPPVSHGTTFVDGDVSTFWTDRGLWDEIETHIFHCNRQSVKLCYRAATVPIHKRLLMDIASHSRGKKNSIPYPVLTRQQLLETREYVAKFEVPSGLHLSSALMDLTAWGGLDKEATEKMQTAIMRFQYETQLTAPSHALQWLADHDKAQYDLLYAYTQACDERLAVRYVVLPRAWAMAQVRALEKHYGSEGHGLHKNAGVFYYCVKCREFRGSPIEYPDGRNERQRLTSHYLTDVAIQVHGTESGPVCMKRGLRDHDRVIKHRVRNKLNAGASKDLNSGQPIDVCQNTPLIRVCLIGILLCTENSGSIALCTQCGVPVKWESKMIDTDMGPVCGCHLPAEDSPKNKPVACGFCPAKPKQKHARTHKLITCSGLQTIHACRKHHTKWVNRAKYMATQDQVRRYIVARDKRVEAYRRKKRSGAVTMPKQRR